MKTRITTEKRKLLRKERSVYAYRNPADLLNCFWDIEKQWKRKLRKKKIVETSYENCYGNFNNRNDKQMSTRKKREERGSSYRKKGGREKWIPEYESKKISKEFSNETPPELDRNMSSE